MQYSYNILEMHDGHLFKYGRGMHENFHGWIFCLWRFFWKLLEEFGENFEKMHENQLSVKLGKESFYGEGIVLGHVVSERGIEFDKAKVELISKLSPPTSVKQVRSFLRHVGFYRWFIKDFSKIVRPLSNLLAKDAPFDFDESCLEAYNFLRAVVTQAPILQPPNWSLPFEIMCDASYYAISACLG